MLLAVKWQNKATKFFSNNDVRSRRVLQIGRHLLEAKKLVVKKNYLFFVVCVSALFLFRLHYLQCSFIRSYSKALLSAAVGSKLTFEIQFMNIVTWNKILKDQVTFLISSSNTF